MSGQRSQTILPCEMRGTETAAFGAPLAAASTDTDDNGYYRLRLPAAVQSVTLISDIHLNRLQPENFQAWQRFMRQAETDVLLLGDVFDVWTGDDILDAPDIDSALPTSGGAATAGADNNVLWQSLQQRQHFARQCVQVLRDCVQAGRRVYLMHGNRDFLLGERFFAETGCFFLPDPCVLQWEAASDTGFLLSHGDALCTGDANYQAFRRQARSSQWQRSFLEKPLFERVQAAEQMREQSRVYQAGQKDYADVDDAAARQWLEQSGQTVLVHGHTHRPACHILTDKADGPQTVLKRYVLSDWEMAASSPRGDALLLHADGSVRRRQCFSG